MFLIQLYFILGLAMLLVVLWDSSHLPKTTSRFVKLQDDQATGFSLITKSIRNLVILGLVAFFIWPWVVWLEVHGNDDK